MALTSLGLQKTTLVDFPGELAATVFTPGCNLRCPYCHNPRLVIPPFPEDMISLEELDTFLNRRAALLGGVCITGGEPLLHEDLPGLISRIRGHGLKVKLDTNGTFPERLSGIDADYIAMDLKTAPSRYRELLLKKGTEREVSLEARIKASVEYLRLSGIPYELRTTVAPGIVGAGDMEEMLPLLPGAQRYVITPFRGGTTLDPSCADRPSPTEALLDQLCTLATDSGVPCEILQ
jgi:pyruvate formate lyase activating enzyme